MVKILYGKPVADKIKNDIAPRAKAAKIAVMLPDEPSSASYKKTIISAAEKLGMQITDPESADGVIGENTDPSKDIDCQTDENLGKLFAGKPLFKPATAQAVVEILKHYDIEIAGKHAVVIGRSTIVGKPLAHLLLSENATVTICHSKTPDIGKFTKEADIVICAAGTPNLLKGDMVNDSSIVIDVGTNFVNGKLTGDVDFDSVSKKAFAVSPVPGGVGPVTTAVLLRQTVDSQV